MCDSRPGDDSRWDPSSWSEHQLCQQSWFWIHDQQTRRQVGCLQNLPLSSYSYSIITINTKEKLLPRARLLLMHFEDVDALLFAIIWLHLARDQQCSSGFYSKVSPGQYIYLATL